LIGTAQGAVKGYCLGLTICTSETYASTGIHDDQEGFYVIEGHGMARMGDVEFEIRPGTAFLAKAGMPHSVRKFPDSVPLKLLWSHGAV
jgi:mannose-6-phosphate isomerase-like protein (cupin superfamily)